VLYIVALSALLLALAARTARKRLTS